MEQNEGGLNLRTTGTNVLHSNASEFAGSAGMLDSLEKLGLRAYNPAEIERNVVNQLEKQLDRRKDPPPMSSFLESHDLVSKLATPYDTVEDGPKVSHATLKKMIHILEVSIKDKMRMERMPSSFGISRVEELQIKVNLLKTLLAMSEKAGEDKYDQLVRTGKIMPREHHRVNKDTNESPPKEKKATSLRKEKGPAVASQNVSSSSSSSSKSNGIDPFGKSSLKEEAPKMPPGLNPFGKAISAMQAKPKEKVKKNKKNKKAAESKEDQVVKREVDLEEPENISDDAVKCPICFRKYSPLVIESHASRCTGARNTKQQDQPQPIKSEPGHEHELETGDSGGLNVKQEEGMEENEGALNQVETSVDDYQEQVFENRVRESEELDILFGYYYFNAKSGGMDEKQALEIAAEKEKEAIETGIRQLPNSDVEKFDGNFGDEDPRFVSVTSNLRMSRRFHSKLFEYQQVCIEWFWKLHRQGTGGILGDEMGLGKTVQVASYLGAMKDSDHLKPSIICCPATTIAQWVSELHKWAPRLRVLVLHASGKAIEVGGWSRSRVISTISKKGDILVTTYQGLRGAQEHVLNRRWGYVILDEGHKIRNPDADITLVCKQLQTVHRIVMTGSPIQNNLKELWSLFDFVSPGRLGTLPMFHNQFAIPINAGGYSNATPVQVRMAYHCALVLKETVEPYLLRRLKKDVAQQLPEKTEQVLFCNLTKVQHDAYENFLRQPDVENLLNRSDNGGKGKVVFKLLRALQHICNHPDLYLDRVRQGSGIMEFINQSGLEEDSDPSKDIAKGNGGGIGVVGENLVNRSGKMLVLKIIMRTWKDQGHRVLLFSQGRMMLDMLERFAQIEGYSYLRMDGTTPIKSRQILIDRFNDEKGGVFVFLLTTKVGGLGINLIGADRVVLFDPDWNPSTDAQARERAWRVGQKKQVTIYRLITSGTIEEKMYHRQIFKQYLTNKILSDPRQRRFLKYSGLRDLFTLGDAGQSANEAGSDNEDEDEELEGTKRKRRASSRQDKRKRRRSNQPVESAEDIRNREYDYTEDFEAAKQAVADTETADLFRDGRVDMQQEDDNTNILKSLFDGSKGGFRQAFKHDTVEELSRTSPDERVIEQEANRIAKRAATALRREQEMIQRTTSGVHVPTWTGISGSTGRIGGSVSSQILQQLRTRNVTASEVAEESHVRVMAADSSDPNMRVARRLHQYLRGGQRTTKAIIDEFKDTERQVEPSTFREILREMADYSNDVWILRPDFQ